MAYTAEQRSTAAYSAALLSVAYILLRDAGMEKDATYVLHEAKRLVEIGGVTFDPNLEGILAGARTRIGS